MGHAPDNWNTQKPWREDQDRVDGLRGEDSIAELCRLAGDTARPANVDEVRDLRRKAHALNEVVAEQTLELRLLKNA